MNRFYNGADQRLKGDPRRYHQLDSLRGAAAFGVLITHILQLHHVLPDGSLNLSPLRILMNGRSFVVFFFVLSGFVLATAIWGQKREISYAAYVGRRCVRLYFPYAAAGVFGALMAWMSVAAPSARQLADYFLTLGTSSGIAINPPSWSLAYEMRLSLAMPLICALIAINFSRAALSAAALFVMEEACILRWGAGQHPYAVDQFVPGLLMTARYGLCFFLGASLAYPAPGIAQARSIIAAHPMISCLIAYVALSLSYDQSAMIGAAVLILLALEWPALRRVLSIKPLAWLGRISYSLYLTHFIVIAAIIAMTEHSVSTRVTAPASLIACLILADLFYRFVEKPSMNLSRRIGA